MKIEDLEKALQYFVIAVPENEEQAKAYFWARKGISALRSVSREQELEAENKELKERIVNWRKYMAPTREQVEKVWRGEWIIGEPDGLGVPIHCNRCGWGSNHADQKKWMEYQGHIFCGRCGAPMSDEAVQMMMERLEAVFQ